MNNYHHHYYNNNYNNYYFCRYKHNVFKMPHTRGTQCLRNGVVVVSESGSDPEEPQEVLMAALGGVHVVPLDDMVSTVVRLARDASTASWRLSAAQARCWEMFSGNMVHWDGTFGELDRILDPATYV